MRSKNWPKMAPAQNGPEKLQGRYLEYKRIGMKYLEYKRIGMKFSKVGTLQKNRFFENFSKVPTLRKK